MIPLHLSCLMPQIADNSKRSVLRGVARQIATDLNRHVAGVEDALVPASGANHTPLGAGVMVVDACLHGMDEPYLLIAHLRHAIDVNAPDHTGVDVVAVLLSSDHDRIGHLRRLSALMRRLHDNHLCDVLRTSGSADTVRALMAGATDLHRRAA